MQSYQKSILTATLIAISLQSCLALNCIATDGTSSTCDVASTLCYIETDANGVVTKGCVDPAVPCTSPSCLSCTTDNCNYLMCKQCVGTQAECATTNVGADTFNQLCPAPNQVCVNRINNNQVTRGCDSACAAGDINCGSCNKDNCNVASGYPESWRQCYQCSGDTCNTNLNNATQLLPCAQYQNEGQKCYTIGTSATTMQRGCTTDTNAKCKADSTDASCIFCDNQNGCNSRAFESVLGSCITCSDNAGCVPAQQADKATPCAASNYTLSENSCFHQTNADGSVARGCTNARTVACNAEDNCQTCNGAACNVADSAFTCLTCSSDRYPACREGKADAGICLNSIASQCFEGQWDGIVVRGCLDDAVTLIQSQCKDGADNRCTVCGTRNCNNKPFNGAATMQHMGLGLLLGVIFFIRQSV